MFLLDTNILGESRKGAKADAGVMSFIGDTENEIFLPVQVISELRSGIEALRLRGDLPQARTLELWLELVLEEFSQHILPFDLQCGNLWGVLMGVNDQQIVDRQIAAIALNWDLTVVTRNTAHFSATGVRVLNPFLADAASP